MLIDLLICFSLTAVQSPRHSASSGVLPDLLPPHTPPQSRSPQNLGQRPQDKTTSDEVMASIHSWFRYLHIVHAHLKPQ